MPKPVEFFLNELTRLRETLYILKVRGIEIEKIIIKPNVVIEINNKFVINLPQAETYTERGYVIWEKNEVKVVCKIV